MKLLMIILFYTMISLTVAKDQWNQWKPDLPAWSTPIPAESSDTCVPRGPPYSDCCEDVQREYCCTYFFSCLTACSYYRNMHPDDCREKCTMQTCTGVNLEQNVGDICDEIEADVCKEGNLDSMDGFSGVEGFNTTKGFNTTGSLNTTEAAKDTEDNDSNATDAIKGGEEKTAGGFITTTTSKTNE